MTILDRPVGRARRRTIATTSLAPLAWGLTYIVTTKFLPPGRPLLAGAVRSLPTGLLLVALSRQLPRGVWWGRVVVLGACNFGLFFALLFVGAYRLPGGVAATIGAVQPLMVAALATALLAERADTKRIVAGVLGIVGVAMLVLRGEAALDAVGVLAALGGAASFAVGTVLVQRWGRPAPLVVFAGWQLAAGGLLLAPLALVVEGVPETLSARNVGGYLYLMIFGAALAYPLWFRGIERLGASAATFLSLEVPVVATFVGLAVNEEHLTAWQVLGSAIVIVSIVIGQSARQAHRRPLPASPESPSSGRTGSRRRAWLPGTTR
jgi:probable blue pigment (indigoidine) exporter